MTYFEQSELINELNHICNHRKQLSAATNNLEESEIYFNRTNELNSPENVARIKEHVNQILSLMK